MSKKVFRRATCNRSRIKCLRPLAGLLTVGVGASAFAQSVPFPTYQVGENKSGSQGPDYPSTLPNQ
jgi:hypothetical protein